MRDRLGADLKRWEAGELSLIELEARHPRQEVGSLVGLHARLTALAAEPAPDPEPAWEALSTRLAARPQETVRLQPSRSRRRVLTAIIAAAVLVPGVAYAAAPDAVRAIAREVTDLLPGEDHSEPEAPDDGPAPASSIPPADLDDSPDTDVEPDDQQDGVDPDEWLEDDDEPDGADPDVERKQDDELDGADSHEGLEDDDELDGADSHEGLADDDEPDGVDPEQTASRPADTDND